MTTSGDSGNDLWIFEVGAAVEPTAIQISRNGNDRVPVGVVGGATSGVDIDAYVGSGVVTGERYSYVRIIDTDSQISGSPYAGVDIDAVGAISSGAKVELIADAGEDEAFCTVVTLDGSSSYSSDDSIVSFDWDLKHRTSAEHDATATGASVTVRGLEAGFYDVTLTVTDSHGNSESDVMLAAVAGICGRNRYIVIPVKEP